MVMMEDVHENDANYISIYISTVTIREVKCGC